jgi:hypothetical protein
MMAQNSQGYTNRGRGEVFPFSFVKSPITFSLFVCFVDAFVYSSSLFMDSLIDHSASAHRKTNMHLLVQQQESRLERESMQKKFVLGVILIVISVALIRDSLSTSIFNLNMGTMASDSGGSSDRPNPVLVAYLSPNMLEEYWLSCNQVSTFNGSGYLQIYFNNSLLKEEHVSFFVVASDVHYEGHYGGWDQIYHSFSVGNVYFQRLEVPTTGFYTVRMNITDTNRPSYTVYNLEIERHYHPQMIIGPAIAATGVLVVAAGYFIERKHLNKNQHTVESNTCS